SERRALVIAVRTDDGATGLGEAAPLPTMSIDSLDDARHATAELAQRVPFVVDSPAHATNLADRITTAPAARFAIETALLTALAQHARASVSALWSPLPHGELCYATVVDTIADALLAVAHGARCLKIKAAS